jgi:hypothetical protein
MYQRRTLLNRPHIASIDDVHDIENLEKPFQLSTPLALRAETGTGRIGCEIYSSSPIRVNGVTIWSAAPIRILDADDGGVVLEPAASLGSFFALGWSTLPTEIKERILSYGLVTKSPRVYLGRRYASQDPYIKILFQRLRSTPEIASLSRDIYYKHNTFLLWPKHAANFHRSLMYPPVSVNGLIRSVQFVCDLDDTASALLTRFARGNYGFKNLRYLKLVFCPDYSHLRRRSGFSQFLHNTIEGGLEFGCEGDLEVVDDSEVWERICAHDREEHPWLDQAVNEVSSGEEKEESETAARRARERVKERATMERMEAVLRKVIRFGCNVNKLGV